VRGVGQLACPTVIARLGFHLRKLVKGAHPLGEIMKILPIGVPFEPIAVGRVRGPETTAHRVALAPSGSGPLIQPARPSSLRWRPKL